MSYTPLSFLPKDPSSGIAAMAHLVHHAAEMEVDSEPPIPSMDPPQHLLLEDEAGPSNSPKFYL
jgi:hypothetical protein